MKGPIALAALGLALILLPVLVERYQQRTLAHDIRDVAALRATLDSLRGVAAEAGTGPDSARLAAEIQSREYFLGRREGHVTYGQAVAPAFWRPTGPGMILVAVGTLLVGAGVARLGWRRRRRTPAARNPT